MEIEIDDELAKQCGLTATSALQIIAIALYKSRGIHGTMAGRLLGLNEIEFHQLLADQGYTVNYSLDDLLDDVGSNDL